MRQAVPVRSSAFSLAAVAVASSPAVGASIAPVNTRVGDVMDAGRVFAWPNNWMPDG